MTNPAVPGYEWLVTMASDKAHTHRADDGRIGWKEHAVLATPDTKTSDLARSRALCGLKPRYGWDVDLYISDQPCARCLAQAVKLLPCSNCECAEPISGAETEEGDSRCQYVYPGAPWHPGDPCHQPMPCDRHPPRTK